MTQGQLWVNDRIMSVVTYGNYLQEKTLNLSCGSHLILDHNMRKNKL